MSLVDGVLYRNTTLNNVQTRQLVLPLHFRSIILKQLHDDLGHQGRDRTLSLLHSRFYWPGLENDVEEKIKNCGRCIRRKTPVKPSAELVNITSSQPMELLCIDFLSLERSKGGHEHILVVTDHFTRYAQAFPTRNQLAKTTAKILFENFVVHYGFPARIHSDQGRNFESSLIKELCSLAGVHKSRTTPYHPMGNGMVERFNQTLLKMLGTLEDHQKQDWKSYVAPLVHAYNATRHDSTGFSPFFLMFGRHPRLAIDAYLGLNSSQESECTSREHYASKLKKRLDFAYKVASKEANKNATRHKSNYDGKVREATLGVGDRVLIRKVGLKGKNKLADRWDKHSYIVIEVPNEGVPVYRVQRESGDLAVKTLHRNMLLPFSAIPSSLDLGLFYDSPHSKPGKPAAPVHSQSKPVQEPEFESDSSESETEELFYPRYMLPLKRKQSSNTNGSKSVSSNKEKSHVSVHGDTFNGSGDFNRSDSSVGFNRSDSAGGFNSSAGGGFASAEVGTTGSSRDLRGGNVGSVDNVPTPQLPRRTGRVRQAPNRYGEWVNTQQVSNPETQIWYV